MVKYETTNMSSGTGISISGNDITSKKYRIPNYSYKIVRRY